MYSQTTVLLSLCPFCLRPQLPSQTCDLFVPKFYGGASSAVRAQCNYLGAWPY